MAARSAAGMDIKLRRLLKTHLYNQDDVVEIMKETREHRKAYCEKSKELPVF